MTMSVNLNIVCAMDSHSSTTGLPRSPSRLSATAKSRLKTTICSTSPSAIALTIESGKTCSTNSCHVCGGASVFTVCGGSTTPMPGLVRFTATSPMAMAMVVTTSK